jgi:aspartate/methionine/tyrosine aminotransferase
LVAVHGRDDLKEAVAVAIARRDGPTYPPSEIVITPGEGDAILDALFVLTDHGDEVILTDPTYAESENDAKARAEAAIRSDGNEQPLEETLFRSGVDADR